MSSTHLPVVYLAFQREQWHTCVAELYGVHYWLHKSRPSPFAKVSSQNKNYQKRMCAAYEFEITESSDNSVSPK